MYNKSCPPLTPDKSFCSTRVQCPLTTCVSWTREPEGVRWAGQRVWPWPSRREVPARRGGGNRAPLLLTSLSYLSFLLRYTYTLASETIPLALCVYLYVDHTFHTVMFLLHIHCIKSILYSHFTFYSIVSPLTPFAVEWQKVTSEVTL